MRLLRFDNITIRADRVESVEIVVKTQQLIVDKVYCVLKLTTYSGTTHILKEIDTDADIFSKDFSIDVLEKQLKERMQPYYDELVKELENETN